MRPRLASGRSPRWALWDRFAVPNYDSDGDYLVRIRIIQTPLFGVYLHRLNTPDPRDTLHDHPWTFRSLVLRGGYVERRLDPHTMQVDEQHVINRFNKVRAHEAHAIIRLLRVPTWTLLLVGRRLRTWGYWEPLEDAAWRWTEFNKHPHAEEFSAALRRRNR